MSLNKHQRAKTPQGTARRLRREHALTMFTKSKLPRAYFRVFWAAGATEEAIVLAQKAWASARSASKREEQTIGN